MQASAGSIMADRRIEGRLHAAVERSLRAGQDWAVVVLHLSALLPPAPRPHHRRIAGAILGDAALRHGGQVFTQPSGDLAMLCRPEGVAGTAETLARLFRVDAPQAEALLTLWRLPADAESVLAYADRPIELVAPPEETLNLSASPMLPSATNAIDALLATARLSDFMRQQIAVRLDGDMRPIFREMAFSMAALQAQIAAIGPARTDPFLLRHLAARLDGRMLGSMAERLPTGELPLHVNLTVTGVLSAEFLPFARAIDRSGLKVAVGLSLLDACADPATFTEAGARLRGQGFTVAMAGVGHPALLLTRAEATGADLVKLDWSARILACSKREGAALAGALGRIGADRVVLQRAETEAAVAWGMAHGIHQFSGRHVDAMLAAARIAACRFAADCTLRQCVERASATGPAGRVGCRDIAGLDAGCPAAAT